jgi:hypothetical protein
VTARRPTAAIAIVSGTDRQAVFSALAPFVVGSPTTAVIREWRDCDGREPTGTRARRHDDVRTIVEHDDVGTVTGGASATAAVAEKP